MTGDTAPADPGEPRRIVHHWTLWSWTMLVVVATVVAIGVAARVLMPSVILDIVSFWPLAVVALLVAVAVGPATRRGSRRLAAAAPLVLLSWLVVAVGLHLSAWETLPSAAADLRGPDPSGVTGAELSIELSGALVTTEATDVLYSVRLQRAGGATGIPEAVERVEDGTAYVDVAEVDGGGWFRTRGWLLALHDGPVWSLDVSAPELALDLTAVSVHRLVVSGRGTVAVAAPPSDATTAIVVSDGRVELELPPDVAARVRGRASVPGTWVAEEDGFRSPVEGAGFDITVGDGASVVVVER